MEERYIPKYLNAQLQILWWDLDEFIVLIIFTGIGLIANHQFFGAVIGYIAMRIYTKLNNAKHPGFVKHFAYSIGLFGLKNKVPEYWNKELVR